MKSILLTALILGSGSVLAASNCFVRNEVIDSASLQLAKEVCFTNIELKLELFSASKAILSYVLDGKEKTKEIYLVNGEVEGSGILSFKFDLESLQRGEMCGRNWYANSVGKILVKKDGSFADVVDVQGNVRFMYDNCHDDEVIKQDLSYSRN